MLYYTKTVDETLKELDTSETGLSSSAAELRLQQYGPNLIKIQGEPLWRKIVEPFTNIFMAVLAVAVIVSLIEHALLDATIIAVIMAVTAGIYYVQRFSTDRVLRSLQKYHKQTISVIRDAQVAALESSDLVPGDIVLLGEGEKVPADLRIIKASSLRADEAQLTGESLPVSKQTKALPTDKEVYERSNMLFQGSFIVSGEATAVVVETGNMTEFGRLSGLSKRDAVKSPVQHKIDKFLSQVIVAVLAIAVVAFGLSMLRGVPLAESVRFVIALSVSAVPESMPVATSVILVLGMRRMAAKKALVRSMSAIETIGSITTIATDKTGTLTKNILSVQDYWQPNWASGKIAALAPLTVNHRHGKTHDPLDTALSHYGTENKVATPRYAPAATFPFDQAVSMSGNLWHNGKEYHLVVKGAPEHVLDRCNLTEDEREEASLKLRDMTGSGYRVLAVAHQTLAKPIKNLGDISKKNDLAFVGFIAVADTLRPEAKKAIQRALKAGVTVRMITGDHFETAYHIGKQLGMVKHRDQVFDSRRMHTMSDEELESVVEQTLIFSRVIPEHKYRILAILKKHHITAMTGDGVNDVPALSKADVGIAMGSGSHIAKDAGDIILLDDNFKSIVDAMYEGRTVAANIRRMLYYLLATNAGEVLTAVSALVGGWPVPLAPVQILWVNLATDTCMVIPLGLEPGKAANMYERPRSLKSSILSRFMVSRIILVAIVMASIALGLFIAFSNLYDHAYGRTIAFNALVVMQWASAFTARSDYESTFSRLKVLNGKFYIGLAIAVIMQALAIFGPLGSFLHVTPVSHYDLLTTSLLALSVPIIAVEVHKYIGRHYFGKGSPKAVA